MVKYAKFNDSDRGDSFQIPPQYYLPGDPVHVPSQDGGPLPPDDVQNASRVEIELARHHIISWKIIRSAWNKCADDKLDQVNAYLAQMLTEKPSISVSPGADEVCWARRNLLIGPVGDHRMFDPGEEIDFEGPIGINGDRARHVAAMVELGKQMQAYIAKTITPAAFQKKFMELEKHCRKIDGDKVCLWDRTEWTLNRKPVVRWKEGLLGWERDGKPAPPLWHRGSFSTASVAQYWRPNASREVIYTETTKLRRAAHTRFVKSLGAGYAKKAWSFLPT